MSDHELEREAARRAGAALFEAVVARAPAGIAVVESAGFTVRSANPAFLAFLDPERRAGGGIGLPLDAYLGAHAAAARERIRLVASGLTARAELETESREDGHPPTTWRFVVVPLRPEGGDAVLLAFDVTEQVAARRRAEALAALASDLNRGHRLEHVLATGEARARELLGAKVALLVRDAVGGLRAFGAAAARGAEGEEPPDPAALAGVAEVLATGRALLVQRSAATEAERRWLEGARADAALVVPLVADERTLGVLVAFQSGEGAPPPDDVSLAGAVTAQIALAVSKMVAIEQERAGAARLALLQTATAAFSVAQSTDDVARALFDHGATALGADAASLVLGRGPGRLETVAARGLSDAQLAPVRAFSTAARFPVAAAVRTKEPVWIDDPAELDREFPGYAPLRRTGGEQAWAALPLLVRGEAIGGVGLAWRRPHRFAPEDRRLVLAIADQCAQALERARLFDAERRARARLALSSALTLALAAARTRGEVLSAMFGAGVEAFGASGAAFWEREDARLRLVDCRAVAPHACEPLRSVPLHAPSPFAEAAREGAAVWAESPEAIAARWGAGAAPEGVAALAAVPVGVPAGGVLGLFFAGPRRFDEEERRFVAGFVGKLAEALERAWFLESERLARERAEAAEAEARRTGELQQRVMAVVGHDLRTPLSAIALAARVLFQRGLSDEQAGTVSRIASSAARMASIVRDLLDFGRIRSGQELLLERRRIDAARVAERAIRELADLHPARTITLEAAGDPALDADPDRLAQVVSNLVANALHHAGEEARVTVRVEGRAQEVVLEVIDDGRGIPPEALEEIFHPFRSGREASGGHLGLGLFIVREIARAHGGDVVVRSRPGHGTTFTVSLPRGARPAPGSPAEGAPPAP